MRTSVSFVYLSIILYLRTSFAQPATATSSAPASSSSPRTGLSLCQQSIVQQLTNIYENSRFPFAFDYCENIKDGRGYTCGIIGFTTATHDALQVIQLYRSSTPNGTEFDSILDSLIKIDREGSSSTNGLSDFCPIWEATAENRTEFRSAQIQIMDEMYYQPSQKLSDELGLKSPLARGQIYDSFIQHGGGGDYDSAPSMVSRTKSAMIKNGLPATPAAGADETTWLTQYLSVRFATLSYASTPETRAAWAQSVTRVKSYQYSLSQNQLYFEDSLIALDNSGRTITVPCSENLWVDYVPWISKQLSAGAIVGIVIAVLVVVAVLAYVLWKYLWIKRKKTPSHSGFTPFNDTLPLQRRF